MLVAILGIVTWIKLSKGVVGVTNIFPFAPFLSFLHVIATKFVCTLCSSNRISLRVNLFQCSIKHGFPQAQVYVPYSQMTSETRIDYQSSDWPLDSG